MKKSMIALAVSGLALASLAQAAPQADTFYSGVRVGGSSVRHAGFSTLAENQGYHRNYVTYGAFGGYQITPNFALELGYDNYGQAKVLTAGKTDSRLTEHGANLSLKASYPLLSDLDVYTRLGAALVRADVKHPAAGGEHSLRVAPLYAGGLEYAVTPDVAFRVEYQWLENTTSKDVNKYKPDVGSVTAGLSYRFGQSQPAPEVITKQFTFGADVLFGFNKANLNQAGQDAISGMLSEVQASGIKNGTYNVAGYTDRIGSDAYNMKLSQARAETVGNYIVSQGVAAEHVTATGYGKADPVTAGQCDNVKAKKALIECLAPNRRVTVGVQGTTSETVEM